MHLEVSFRNVRPRDEIRRRSQALFRKLERFLDPAAEGQLVVAVEHGVAVIEGVVGTRGMTFKASEEDEDLRAALDKTFHNLERQLRRAKERRVARRQPGREDLAEELLPETYDEGEEILDEDDIPTVEVAAP